MAKKLFIIIYGFDYLYSQDYVGKGVIVAALFARMRMNMQK